MQEQVERGVARRRPRRAHEVGPDRQALGEPVTEQEAGDADRQDEQDDAGDDVAHSQRHRQEREQQCGDGPDDGAADDPGEGASGRQRDGQRAERARQEGRLDPDEQDAGA